MDFHFIVLPLSTTDVSARTTMKGTAKCDEHRELQNSVNQQFGRALHRQPGAASPRPQEQASAETGRGATLQVQRIAHRKSALDVEGHPIDSAGRGDHLELDEGGAAPSERFRVDVVGAAFKKAGHGQVRRALDVEGLPIDNAGRGDHLELDEGGPEAPLHEKSFELTLHELPS